MNPDFFIVLLAAGLSLDCFSVSMITSIYKCLDLVKAFKLALILAFFQALMFVAGWYLGKLIFTLLGSAEFMIAASILIVIGIKKILAALNLKHDEKSFNIDLNIILYGLALANSLDSFITSLGSDFFQISIKMQVIYLYAASAIFSLIGIFFGKNLPCKLCPKISIIIGGIILIALGTYMFIVRDPI
ncbi:manganese efflux pump MntP family protein [candidate division KSB1 bacterium]